jgi:hypothetical protein
VVAACKREDSPGDKEHAEGEEEVGEWEEVIEDDEGGGAVGEGPEEEEGER